METTKYVISNAVQSQAKQKDQPLPLNLDLSVTQNFKQHKTKTNYRTDERCWVVMFPQHSGKHKSCIRKISKKFKSVVQRGTYKQIFYYFHQVLLGLCNKSHRSLGVALTPKKAIQCSLRESDLTQLRRFGPRKPHNPGIQRFPKRVLSSFDQVPASSVKENCFSVTIFGNLE